MAGSIRRTKTGRKVASKGYIKTTSSDRVLPAARRATGRLVDEVAVLRRATTVASTASEDQRKDLAKLSKENAALRKKVQDLQRALADAARTRDVQPSPEQTLIALAARRRYAPVLERRAVDALSAAGLTQAQIADLAGVSQAHVSRTLTLLADHPELLEPDPQEVGWRYALGDLSEAEMLATLSTWPYTFGREREDAWERGSWDSVMLLVADRFLTTEQYEKISRAVGASRAR